MPLNESIFSLVYLTNCRFDFRFGNSKYQIVDVLVIIILNEHHYHENTLPPWKSISGTEIVVNKFKTNAKLRWLRIRSWKYREIHFICNDYEIADHGKKTLTKDVNEDEKERIQLFRFIFYILYESKFSI